MTTSTLDTLSGEQIIDSRAVIERLDELEASDDLDDERKRDELTDLRAVADAGSSTFEDWQYGEALIRDDYFEDYARELAEDIGAIQSDAGWPMDYIDWPRAAEALRMDYSSIEIDGITYWGR